MRDHPITSVTEPLQYRAIGIVRGTYTPKDPEKFTRGFLVDDQGLEMEAVVLGKVLTLMRRHIEMDRSHIWVVYPRCRDTDKLHLQIVGIWEPSTLGDKNTKKDSPLEPGKSNHLNSDELPEGDDYFSIRGELIYTKPQDGNFIVKVRQKSRADKPRRPPFKLTLKGNIPLEHLRHFVSLQVRRNGQELKLEDYDVIAPIQTRGGKRRPGKGTLGGTKNQPKHS